MKKLFITIVALGLALCLSAANSEKKTQKDSRNNPVIPFRDFIESNDNDGTIANSCSVYYHADHDGMLVENEDFTVEDLPDGLSAEVTAIDDSTVVVSLLGAATESSPDNNSIFSIFLGSSATGEQIEFYIWFVKDSPIGTFPIDFGADLDLNEDLANLGYLFRDGKFVETETELDPYEMRYTIWSNFRISRYGNAEDGVPSISTALEGTDWLIFPAIDLGEGPNNLSLKFTMKQTQVGETDEYYFHDEKLMLVVSTDGGITWNKDNSIIIADYMTNLTGEDLSINIPLYNYSGVVKFAMYEEYEGFIGESGGLEIFLKDIVISEDLVCDPLTVAYCTHNYEPYEANFSWFSHIDNSSISIEYGLTGFIQGEGTLVEIPEDADSYTISNLSDTIYDFYITSVCEGGLENTIKKTLTFERGLFCENPIIHNIGDPEKGRLLDSFDEDWYRVIAGQSYESANIMYRGDYGSDFLNFKIEIYDECGGNLIAESGIHDDWMYDTVITINNISANDIFYVKIYSEDGVWGNYFFDVIAVTNIENHTTNGINVYPNPANDNIMIQNAEGQSISIINALGQTIKQIENATENQNLDLSNFANGFYFVKVNDQIVKFNVIK